MACKKVLVFVGSVREGRHGIKVANLMVKQLQSIGLESSLLDPVALESPLMKQALHFMPDQSAAPQWMLDTKKMIEEAHGFVVVSPEYNATICPTLTNLMNYFPPAIYRHKPVSITTYSMGSFGGIRCQAALRPFLAELGLVSLPSTVVIPMVQNSGIEEDGTCSNERVSNSVDKLCKELDWYIGALQGHKLAVGSNPN